MRFLQPEEEEEEEEEEDEEEEEEEVDLCADEDDGDRFLLDRGGDLDLELDRDFEGDLEQERDFVCLDRRGDVLLELLPGREDEAGSCCFGCGTGGGGSILMLRIVFYKGL